MIDRDEVTEFYEWYWGRPWVCGCGCPEDVLEVVIETIEIAGMPHPRPSHLLERMYTPGREFIIAVLNSEDLLEHGGSHYHGWPTPAGLRRLEQMKKFGRIMLRDNIETADALFEFLTMEVQ